MLRALACWLTILQLALINPGLCVIYCAQRDHLRHAAQASEMHGHHHAAQATSSVIDQATAGCHLHSDHAVPVVVYEWLSMTLIRLPELSSHPAQPILKIVQTTQALFAPLVPPPRQALPS